MYDSPQVKRNLISSITKLVYELSERLPNDLELRITYPMAFSPLGGPLCPHKKKKNLGSLSPAAFSPQGGLCSHKKRKTTT